LIALLLVQFALPPDSLALKRVGEAVGVPAAVMYAVAWQETRLNVNPAIRGPGRLECDSIGNCRRICREIGRLQINPCIQWRHPACAVASLKIYASNLRCGAAILRSARDGALSWADALRIYNGSGVHARIYAKEALAYVGWLALLTQEVPPLVQVTASTREFVQ